MLPEHFGTNWDTFNKPEHFGPVTEKNYKRDIQLSLQIFLINRNTLRNFLHTWIPFSSVPVKKIK
jgi:hypothetical protein